MKKKIFLSIVIIITTAIVFCGCGGPSAITRPPITITSKMFTVEGSCTAELIENNTVLKVHGTTNLMDGTNGVITVLNTNGKTIEEIKIQKQGDNLSYDFTVNKEWADDVYAFISFDTQQGDKQSSEVAEAYGKKFEYLEGEDVIWNQKGVIACFQSELVTIR